MDELFEEILEEEETPEEPGVWSYPHGGKYYAEVFNGIEEDAIENGFVKVTKEDYIALTEHKLCWNDGRLVPAPESEILEWQAKNEANRYREEREEEIISLKRFLSQTDYQALKYGEGWYSEEEYAPIREQRQSARDRINYLQSLNT